MPELPEVESVRRKLSRWTTGARLVSAVASDRRIVRGSLSAFAKLEGRTFRSFERRGKWLRIGFGENQYLYSHLGMTGDWELEGEERFERARFEIVKKKKKNVLRYTDPRRWGVLALAGEDFPPWAALGPDPLHDGIDIDRLEKKLSVRAKKSVKEVIMEQKVLAGIGNIQAIESLWKAHIHPKRKAASIEHEEVVALVKAIEWSIARTLADLELGDAGKDNPFKIYGNAGRPCPRCKTILQRFELGGRTTTACATCQPLAKVKPSRTKPSAKRAKTSAPQRRRSRR